MRLRRHLAALALACAAAGGGATRAALGQSSPGAAGAPAEGDNPRPVDVTVQPVPAVPPRGVLITPPGAPPPRQPSTVTLQAPTPGPSPSPAPESDKARQLDERRRTIELYRAQFGGKLTKAAYLGVSTSAVPAALRQHLGLQEGVGLVVDFVEPDSPAAGAGLKQYDILTKLNDQILVNAQQLAVLLRSYKSGDEVKLTLVRGGKEQSLSAHLVEKEVKPIPDLFSGWEEGNLPSAEFDRFSGLDGRRGRDLWEDRARIGASRQAHPSGRQNDGGERTMMVWRDNDMTLTLSGRGQDGGRHLIATDKSGKVLFDGEVNNDKERSALPKEVAKKLKQMEAKLPEGAGGGGGGGGGGSDARPDPGTRGSIDVAPQFSPEFRVEGSFNLARPEPAREDDPADSEPRAEGPATARRSSEAPIVNNDVLNIDIHDVHGPGVKTVKTARVRDGRVRLPYVEPVKAEGLTESQLEKRIVSAYVEAKVAPNVSVHVTRVRPATDAPPSPVPETAAAKP